MALLTAAGIATLDGSSFTVGGDDVVLISKNEIGAAWTSMLSLLYGTPDVRLYGQQHMQKVIWLTVAIFGYISNYVTGHAVQAKRRPALGGVYLPALG